MIDTLFINSYLFIDRINSHLKSKKIIKMVVFEGTKLRFRKRAGVKKAMGKT
jgi:hypothetical protein